MTRPNAQERGYGWRWQKARESFLSKNRWCARHKEKGVNEIATVVDHIIAPRMRWALESGDKSALREAQALFWDKSNWQPLCAHCHNSIKQSHESGGSRASCNEDGLPTHKGHHWGPATEDK